MRDGDDYIVRTILTHTSGETIQDHGMPLVGWRDAKNPSQALVAATTYSRRAGLSSLVGIAPEDDDGQSLTQDKPVTLKAISEDQVDELLAIADEVAADMGKFCAYLGVKSIAQIDVQQFGTAKAALEKKRAA